LPAKTALRVKQTPAVIRFARETIHADQNALMHPGAIVVIVDPGGAPRLDVEELDAPDAQPDDEPATQPEEPAAQHEEPAAQPEEPAAQPEEPAAQPEEPAALAANWLAGMAGRAAAKAAPTPNTAARRAAPAAAAAEEAAEGLAVNAAQPKAKAKGKAKGKAKAKAAASGAAGGVAAPVVAAPKAKAKAKAKAKGKAKAAARGAAAAEPAPEEPAPKEPAAQPAEKQRTGAETEARALELYGTELTALCKECMFWVPIKTSRLLTKVKPTWRCAYCQACVQNLYRSLGTSSPEGWDKVPDGEKKAWFRNLSSNPGQLVVQATSLLSKYEDKQRFFVQSGTFLPLLKWERDGFDAADIESKSLPSDIMMHPVLGKTYRVPLTTTGDKESSGSRTDWKHEAKGKKRKMKAAALEAAAEQVPACPSRGGAAGKKNGEPDDSDSDSSSSSSSSNQKKSKHKSSKKEKKKKRRAEKKKQQEKEEKAKLLEAQKAQKEEDKKKSHETIKALALARSSVAKIAPVLLQMQGLSIKAMYAQIPAAVREAHNKLTAKISAMHHSANVVVAQEQGMLSWTAADLSSVVVECKKSSGLTSVMVNQLEQTHLPAM
jgi:hypothetical protein